MRLSGRRMNHGAEAPPTQTLNNLPMKIPSLLLAGVCTVLLPSCVEPYYAGDLPPRQDGPLIVESQPVVVERRRYVEQPAAVRVERHSQTYREPRPYYGDPVPDTRYQTDPLPGSTYQRTTTRTYQGY